MVCWFPPVPPVRLLPPTLSFAPADYLGTSRYLGSQVPSRQAQHTGAHQPKPKLRHTATSTACTGKQAAPSPPLPPVVPSTFSASTPPSCFDLHRTHAHTPHTKVALFSLFLHIFFFLLLRLFYSLSLSYPTFLFNSSCFPPSSSLEFCFLASFLLRQKTHIATSTPCHRCLSR